MGPDPLSDSICGHSKVAAPLAIAAPVASYAVDFSQHLKSAELLPPAAADCATGKIDEHREDESQRLRQQPVHGSGAAPECAATRFLTV
jgi:hypothetical protein